MAPASVVLRDVSLRDGLQDEDPIDVDAKLAIFEAVVAAGVTQLEIGSFVREDRVPAMAGTDALCERTAAAEPPVTRWGLALNRRGAERALAAGLRHLQYVVSVSETHSRRNAGTDVAGAMQGLADVVALGHEAGAQVEVTLSTAWGCPFEGPVDPGLVEARATEAAALGVDVVNLGDTIGVAVPTEVASLFDRLALLGVPLAAHFHDTRGLGVANALAAVEHGATRLDASLGGLGGCPFAPGATGNVAIEDLAHAFGPMGIDTGLDVAGLVRAAHVACDAVGRPVASHVGVAGPRFAQLA